MQSEIDVEELIRTESLPHDGWDKYYDRIYVDQTIKEKLVNYGLLLEQFQKQGFDDMTLAYHGAVLLYGPPGTGKTTLARGVANKVAQEVSGSVKFREVRVEQLFSGTLGDTPKAVANVFDTLIESAEAGTKQIVLFDEVESLISNRDTLVGETDPMDVARAVNVALERIDELSKYSDIYLISTSNLPSAVDSAFFDRADVHFRIGNPAPEHRAQILTDILNHLNDDFGCSLPTDAESIQPLVELTDGFSGRRIRKTVLESIVGDRTTINDPSQFTLDQIEQTAESARTRLLDEDADEISETELYESESDRSDISTDESRFESQPEELKPSAPDNSSPEGGQAKATGIGGETTEDVVENAGSESMEGHTEDSTENRIERDLPIDEGVSGKTERALARARTFLVDLLAAAGHDNHEIVESVLKDDNVESSLYPVIMGQSLRGIRVDVGDQEVFLAADYGMGVDGEIPQPLDDVRRTIPASGTIEITFLLEKQHGELERIESLQVESEAINIATEQVNTANGR